MNDVSGAVFLLFYAAFWLLLLFLFVTPSIIAFRRSHPNRWLILMVNIFLGGTGIGWGVALVWALRLIHLPGGSASSQGGESGLNIFANDVQRVRIGPNLSSSTAREGMTMTTDDVLEQIERLQLLRAEGHISETEFARLKTTVLSKL